MNLEVLVALQFGIALHLDREGARRRLGGQGHGTRRQDSACEVPHVGAGMDHLPSDADRPAHVARAGHAEGDGRGAALALVHRSGQGRKVQHRGRNIVVQDRALGGGRTDRNAVPRRGEDNGEALVRLDETVALDLNPQGLARLAGLEPDRTRGQRSANEVVRIGAVGRHLPDRTDATAAVARARDREGERNGPAVALRLDRVQRRNGQRGRLDGVVVADRGRRRGCADERTPGRLRQVNLEGLVALECDVALDLDREGAGRFAGRQGQGTGR